MLGRLTRINHNTAGITSAGSSLILVFLSCLFCLANPVDAAIVATGDVDPATWTSSTDGYIGKTGAGAMNITGGDEVFSRSGHIGYSSDSAGQVMVDGIGSEWTSNAGLYVGGFGIGEMSITGGGMVSCDIGYVGYEYGSTGEITVSGDPFAWTNSSALNVGYEGRGTLNIIEGGLVKAAALTITESGDDDDFNMASGGMLALLGDAGDSWADFLGLIEGFDAVNYWNDFAEDWRRIKYATEGEDYTLRYFSSGDLAGYTVLAVGVAPEPSTIGMILAGLVTLLFVKLRR